MAEDLEFSTCGLVEHLDFGTFVQVKSGLGLGHLRSPEGAEFSSNLLPERSMAT